MPRAPSSPDWSAAAAQSVGYVPAVVRGESAALGDEETPIGGVALPLLAARAWFVLFVGHVLLLVLSPAPALAPAMFLLQRVNPHHWHWHTSRRVWPWYPGLERTDPVLEVIRQAMSRLSLPAYSLLGTCLSFPIQTHSGTNNSPLTRHSLFK